VLLNELLVDFYAPTQGISERTQVLYAYTIGAFSKHLGRPATIADLNEMAVARFLTARVREKCPATAAKDRAQVRAIWEWAARRAMVPTFPAVRRIVVPERVPEAWTTEEFRGLLAAAALEQGTVAGVPAGEYWRALLLFLYETGERIGAVMQLRWEDVRGRDVVFRAETRKHGRRDTCRTISASCQEAICAIQGDSELVFPWDRVKTQLWYRMGRICKRAGLSNNRRSKFHRVRKTTASYYEAAGGSAQALLDHSSPAVTRRYLDPRIVKTKAASDILPAVS
jgi:hypothetical protein